MSFHSSEDRAAIRAMLRRAAVVSVDDSGDRQLLDLSAFASDLPRKVARIQDFGFASNPPVGGEGLLLCPGGRSDRAVFVGGEAKQYRPKNTELGGTILYDANGQAVSLVKNNIRIVGTDTVTITAPTIVLAGNVHLGGADATRPASAQGTTDSHGDTDTGNFATKVFVK